MASGALDWVSGLDLVEREVLSFAFTDLVPEGVDRVRWTVRVDELDAVVGPPLSDEIENVAEVGLDDIAMPSTQTRIRLITSMRG